MKNREVDISEHRSRALTREDVISSDLIYAMSVEHAFFITGLVPFAKEKIKVWNITDPIGMGIQVYEDVMKAIEKKTKENWSEIAA